MNTPKPKVLVILGPTASGKSDLAVKLALRLRSGQAKNGCEVISADSRQVYKGLNVGTGKITKKEMRGVPHHLLDVADPKKQFTASEYQKLGQKALEEIFAKGRLPIVVGGTGFYIDTLTCAINFPNVPPNKLLRSKLDKLDKETLFELLKKKDPVRAGEVDPHNKLRLIRALEIVEALGKVPKLAPAQTAHEFVYIGLKPENEELENRVLERLHGRLPGMIKEAKKLHSQGLTYKRMHELGLEYRYLALYLQGKLTKEEMAGELYKEIKKYSKRQMTWFKRNLKIKWFTPSSVDDLKPEEYSEIEKYATIALEKGL